MGRENVDNWHVRKCAQACEGCGAEFRDRETLYSRLLFDEGQYRRQDFCSTCWKNESTALSSWKTIFIVPPPPAEEPLRKENAESLLRRLLAKENDEDLDAIFILAVMLERKKILVERDARREEDGRKLRIYEHRKTNESFIVVDPELRLDELEEVQRRVVLLLGGQPPGAPKAPDISMDTETAPDDSAEEKAIQ